MYIYMYIYIYCLFVSQDKYTYLFSMLLFYFPCEFACEGYYVCVSICIYISISIHNNKCIV